MEKVFVSRNNTAAIKCPNCANVKMVSVEQLKGKAFIINAKCPCGAVFKVSIDFRRTYRKSINLPAHIQMLARGGGWLAVLVRNISKGGVGLVLPARYGIEVGDELVLQFTLDDRNHTEIERKIVVRLVDDSFLGCEFIGPVQHEQEKALGFYLMP